METGVYIRFPDALMSGTTANATTVDSTTPPFYHGHSRKLLRPFPEYLRGHEHVTRPAGKCYRGGRRCSLATFITVGEG